MNAEEKYPLLIGHSIAGRTRLHNIEEVANFICVHGQYSDLAIMQKDGTPFLDTFGIYINKIADMEYRQELLKVLIPMQTEMDGTNRIEEENDEMEWDNGRMLPLNSDEDSFRKLTVEELAEEQDDGMDEDSAPVMGK